MKSWLVPLILANCILSVFGQPKQQVSPKELRDQIAPPSLTMEELECRYGTDYEREVRDATGVPNAGPEDRIIAYRYNEGTGFWFFQQAEDQHHWLGAWRVNADFANRRRFSWVFETTRDELVQRLGAPIPQDRIEGEVYSVDSGTLRFYFRDDTTVARVTWQGEW